MPNQAPITVSTEEGVGINRFARTESRNALTDLMLSETRAIGERHAKELAFTGRPIGAEESMVLNELCPVVPAGTTGATALEVAGEIEISAPLAVIASKQTINRSALQTFEETLGASDDLSTLLMTSEDRKKSIRLLRQKAQSGTEGSVMRKHVALVIGGGHCGMTCGAYLSRAGKKTLGLEQKPFVGGASVTEEFSPGFRATTYSFIMGHLHPKVTEELELVKFGLEYYPQPNVFNPTEDDGIVYSKDPAKTREQIARSSKNDAENYPRFFARLQSTIEILRKLQLESPTNPIRIDPAGIMKTLAFAWRYRNTENEFYNLLHALSMSAHDYVSQWFENDLVRAKFMFWATIGGNVGPYSPGTAFNLVTHLIGQVGMSFCKGGMGSIAEATRKSGEAHGMEVQCDAWVDEVLVRDGKTYGVRLRSGEDIHASRVISNVNVKRTFLDLVDERHLPEDSLDEVKGCRSRVMDRFAPDFSDSVVDHKLITPKDIESDINMPGGISQHGELTLDQIFFMQPVSRSADYRSLVENLFHCGASTHPGRAVSAIPGHNAAGEILNDWRWRV